jgi:hypothetical protein
VSMNVPVTRRLEALAKKSRARYDPSRADGEMPVLTGDQLRASQSARLKNFIVTA